MPTPEHAHGHTLKHVEWNRETYRNKEGHTTSNRDTYQNKPRRALCTRALDIWTALCTCSTAYHTGNMRSQCPVVVYLHFFGSRKVQNVHVFFFFSGAGVSCSVSLHLHKAIGARASGMRIFQYIPRYTHKPPKALPQPHNREPEVCIRTYSHVQSIHIQLLSQISYYTLTYMCTYLQRDLQKETQ